MKIESRHLTLLFVVILIVLSIVLIQYRAQFFSSRGQFDLGPTSDDVLQAIGEEAPDFILLDDEDQIRQLSSYRGTPIVLNFWASWCPFCVDELPDFQTVYDELSDNGTAFKIIAINRGESLEEARSFTNEMNLSFDLLMNRADDVARSYNLRAMPSTYFIDAKGVVVDIKRGPMKAEEIHARITNNFFPGESIEIDEGEEEAFPVDLPDELMNSSRTISVTDGVKHSIPLEAILAGGPPKDGIPSIDNPQFVSIEEANTFLDDDGLGISVSFNGVNRFYPNQILVWHEIVNDVIDDQPFLVTYCPLCGTGVVFEPIVNGIPTEFGTSGKLWNSNLIMYDRQTDSYWSQVLGEAVVGEQTGTKLRLLPYQNSLYKDWKIQFPNGQVLSTDTGYRRDYTTSPYAGYESNLSIFSPVDHENDMYHPKSPTYQIEVNNEVKIYPIEELEKGPAIFDDQLGGVDLTITYNQSNQTITILEKGSGREVIPVYGFWFSIIAVHPEAKIYQFGK